LISTPTQIMSIGQYDMRPYQLLVSRRHSVVRLAVYSWSSFEKGCL